MYGFDEITFPIASYTSNLYRHPLAEISTSLDLLRALPRLRSGLVHIAPKASPLRETSLGREVGG